MMLREICIHFPTFEELEIVSSTNTNNDNNIHIDNI